MIEDTLLELRPMMKISELVPYLKKKNIKFEKINEHEAEEYLRNNNNYYNLISYKHNFLKYPSPAGEYEGLYQDLDFAYLKDMSIIDHRVRLLFFKIIIDIEHYLKIRILNLIDNIEEENGYRIVNMYLDKDFNDEKFPKRVHNSIFKKVGNEYYNKIFSKYDIDQDKQLKNIPVWEFLEFFSKEYKLINEVKNIYILREIVKLRNAVAHNACLLSDFDRKDNVYTPDYKIIKFLKDCRIGKQTRDNKLSNSRIRQMTYALYMFDEIVTSNGIKKNIIEDINELFFKRIIKHKEYYNNNELLKSIYLYFKKIIEKKYNPMIFNSY